MALESSGWRCGRCGAAGALEVHHRVELHKGGSEYDPANLEVVCRPCHIDAHRRRLSAPARAWKRLVDELL